MRCDVAAIILARGGSKGVTRKNARDVGGISLLARAIRTTKAARIRSKASRGNRAVAPEVFVSTDDGWLAAIANAEGAHVIDRPAELATDTAQGMDALRHAASHVDCDMILLVQCTAPMMTTADVERTAHSLECGYDMTVACVPFHGVVMSDAGKLLTYDLGGDENHQGRDPLWRIAGSVWCFSPSYLAGDWYSGCVGRVPSDYPICLDIDTPEDLELARLVVSGIKPERSRRAQSGYVEVAERHDRHGERGHQAVAGS